MLWDAASNLVVNALFVAGVLGSLAAPRVIDRFPTGILMITVGWSFVPPLVPLVLWNHPAVVAAALGIGVFLNPVGNAGIGACKTAITPPELLGRATAATSLVGWTAMPLAPLLGGALLTALGGREAMAALALLTAAVALIPTLSRSVRAAPRPAQWRVEQQVEWSGAGGGQRLRAGAPARPQPEGPSGEPLRPAGAPAGHP